MASCSSIIWLLLDTIILSTKLSCGSERTKPGTQNRRHCPVQKQTLLQTSTLCSKITELLKRKNGDIFVATIEYRREVGGRTIYVNRSLRHPYPFMNVETVNPQERITGLDEGRAVGTTAPEPSIPEEEIQDESTNAEC